MTQPSHISYGPPKRPNSVEPYFIIWCDEDATNTGSATDDGELQGATILTSTWTVPTGITKDSESEAQVTIKGVTYAINTVTTIWVSGGISGNQYALTCKITTSDSRTLEHVLVIPVE